MLTSAIITLAQSEAPDWSRTKLLTYLDELQKKVFLKNTTSQMRIYDSTTGKDPILVTTPSTFEYSINTTNGFPNNAWTVNEVYIDNIKEPETNILVIKATPSTAYAKIIFNDAPSGSYYIRCYRFPNSLTTEQVQLEIPIVYHLDIYDGLIGLIEKSRSGKSERYMIFEKETLPIILKGMSDSRNRNTEVPYRSCGE
jgi:hypothetical protein